MDDNHLFGTMQTFIQVVESGSFTECARLLGSSQPSVSRQINLLEEHLGARLLQRTTRRLSLTEAGQLYYDRARQIQRDVIEAGLSIRDLREAPSGLLRISLPHTWADKIITPHLKEFLSLYPDIKLHLECNDQIQDMIEDRLDLVIRVGQPVDSSYIAVPFGEVRMLLCASPEYLLSHGTPVTPDEVSQHNFIIFEDYTQLIFDHDSSKQITNVRGNLYTNNVNVMLTSVTQGLGITLLPDMLLEPMLKAGTLVDIMPGADISVKGLPVNQVFLLYANRKHLPAKVRAFIDFFKPKFNHEPSPKLPVSNANHDQPANEPAHVV